MSASFAAALTAAANGSSNPAMTAALYARGIGRCAARSRIAAIAYRHVGGGRAAALAEPRPQRQPRQPRYLRSNPNAFAWWPNTTATVTNERHRNIRLAQNSMPNGGWA